MHLLAYGTHDAARWRRPFLYFYTGIALAGVRPVAFLACWIFVRLDRKSVV